MTTTKKAEKKQKKNQASQWKKKEKKKKIWSVSFLLHLVVSSVFYPLFSHSSHAERIHYYIVYR
jgi:predicted transcriptional regulator YdeE